MENSVVKGSISRGGVARPGLNLARDCSLGQGISSLIHIPHTLFSWSWGSGGVSACLGASACREERKLSLSSAENQER